MEKKPKYDHHFAKGVAPAEVIMELLNRDGFISDEQMRKWDEMSLEKKLQYAAKMQQPKVGRPSKSPEINLGGYGKNPYAQQLADKALKEGPQAYEAPTPVGRPLKPQAKWTAEELDLICSKQTLIRHAEQSLQYRAMEYTQLFGKRIDVKTLRALYEGRGISLQHCRVRRGDPFPLQKEEQELLIADLQQRIHSQMEKNYDIVFVDQCVYSASSLGHRGKVWGPIGDPIQVKPGLQGGKYVAQMAAASIKNGLIYYNHTVGRGYKKEDVCQFLEHLRFRFKDKKFAVFLDNAKIHDNEMVRATAYDLDIPLIFNMKYRPEFNGIENLWVRTKAGYKKHILGCRMRGEKWCNVELAESFIKSVSKETIIKGIERGIHNIQNAKPILKRQAEKDQDDLNELIGAMDNFHIDPQEEQKRPDPQDNSDEQEIIGEARSKSSDNDDWEPMPLDNYPNIERKQPQQIDRDQIRPKRQARVKFEEKLLNMEDDTD